MDQPVKAFTSEGGDVRRWMGRIIMAVILGEAIWNLIVSVMNNLVVPWLGDVMGQSSGLPASFTQRPYNYPDLFVSILEFCSAGVIAVIINYLFQRQRAVKPVKSLAPTAPVAPAGVVPQAAAAAATTQATSLVAPPLVVKLDPVGAPAPVTVAPAPPDTFFAPRSVARSVAVAPSAPPFVHSVPAKSLQPAPKAEPSKLKKPKEVYYNIVGEPVPPDED